MRVRPVPADRVASLSELRGGFVLLLAAGVELSLPKLAPQVVDAHVIVKSGGAGCKVSSAGAGLEIGEGATSGDPVALTLTTSDVTLLPGEARTYAWDGRGWLLVARTIAPSALRLGAEEPALVGTGDGSTVNFDLPVSDVATLIVAVSGAVQLPAAYSVSQGAGTDGVDRLVFGVAPAGSAPIVVWYARTTAI